jgi:hypothetical protein
VAFDAPLGAKANPGLSPNPTKAPWYFAGIQELLLHFHPLLALFVIPVLVSIALVGIPYLNYPSDTGGVWFASRQGRRAAVVALAVGMVATPIGILADEFVIDFHAWMPDLPPVVTDGILPAASVLAVVGVLYGLLRRRYQTSLNVSVQSIFILLVTALTLLTITGIWFRGEGMALTWPWGAGGHG